MTIALVWFGKRDPSEKHRAFLYSLGTFFLGILNTFPFPVFRLFLPVGEQF